MKNKKRRYQKIVRREFEKKRNRKNRGLTSSAFGEKYSQPLVNYAVLLYVIDDLYRMFYKFHLLFRFSLA